jgi:hypothetical protein
LLSFFFSSFVPISPNGYLHNDSFNFDSLYTFLNL